MSMDYAAARGGKAKGSDPRGPHVRLYYTLIDSHAWLALTPTEIALYVAMRRHLKGSNNGDISASMDTMRHYGFRSATTLAKSLRALQAVGLIARTRNVGGLARGGTECVLYRFTDERASANPGKGVAASLATNEHLRWKSRGEVEAAIRAAHLGAKRPGHPNGKGKNKVQNLERHGPDSGAPLGSKWSIANASAPDSGLSRDVVSAPESAQTRASASSPPNSPSAEPASRESPDSGHLYRLPMGERSERAASAAATPPTQKASATTTKRAGKVSKPASASPKQRAESRRADSGRKKRAKYGAIPSAILRYVQREGTAVLADIVKHVVNKHGTQSAIYAAINRLRADGRLVDTPGGLTLAGARA